MALNPIASLILGIVFLVSTAIIFGFQIVAYRGAAALERELAGEDGERLMGIVRRFFRGMLFAQALGAVVILLYVVGPDETAFIRATLIVGAQLTAALASVIALNRIRGLLDEPPVEGSGEAVVKVQTQTTTEVKVTTSHVGATVDDGGTDDSSLPAEVNQSPAG